MHRNVCTGVRIIHIIDGLRIHSWRITLHGAKKLYFRVQGSPFTRLDHENGLHGFSTNETSTSSTATEFY